MATKVGDHRGEVKVARPNSDNMTFEVRYIFVRGSHGFRNPHLNDGGANFPYNLRFARSCFRTMAVYQLSCRFVLIIEAFVSLRVSLRLSVSLCVSVFLCVSLCVVLCLCLCLFVPLCASRCCSVPLCVSRCPLCLFASLCVSSCFFVSFVCLRVFLCLSVALCLSCVSFGVSLRPSGSLCVCLCRSVSLCVKTNKQNKSFMSFSRSSKRRNGIAF